MAGFLIALIIVNSPAAVGVYLILSMLAFVVAGVRTLPYDWPPRLPFWLAYSVLFGLPLFFAGVFFILGWANGPGSNSAAAFAALFSGTLGAMILTAIWLLPAMVIRWVYRTYIAAPQRPRYQYGRP